MRSPYRYTIVVLFHRPATMMAGSSIPLAIMSWVAPTRVLWPDS